MFWINATVIFQIFSLKIVQFILLVWQNKTADKTPRIILICRVHQLL